MQAYRVVAMGDRTADAVRTTLRSPGYGHPTHSEVASGLNGYASGRRLVAQKYVSNGAVEPEIERLLRDRDVAYIHVRDTDAGCYDFLIERTTDEDDLEQDERSIGGPSHE
jgi:Protein of unknown function (DUF1203)